MLGPTRTQYFVPTRHIGATLRAAESTKVKITGKLGRTHQRVMCSRVQRAFSHENCCRMVTSSLDHLAADTLDRDIGPNSTLPVKGLWVSEQQLEAILYVLREAKPMTYDSGVYNEYHRAERYLTSPKGD